LKKLEIHFDKLDDELFNEIFSAVPNVKKLMSNVPKDTVQKIIKNGKLANVESSEYVKEHWIFPTFVRANKKFNDINCSCHRLFTRMMILVTVASRNLIAKACVDYLKKN
jgi:hypothetical protein